MKPLNSTKILQHLIRYSKSSTSKNPIIVSFKWMLVTILEHLLIARFTTITIVVNVRSLIKNPEKLMHIFRTINAEQNNALSRSDR